MSGDGVLVFGHDLTGLFDVITPGTYQVAIAPPHDPPAACGNLSMPSVRFDVAWSSDPVDDYLRHVLATPRRSSLRITLSNARFAIARDYPNTPLAADARAEQVRFLLHSNGSESESWVQRAERADALITALQHDYPDWNGHAALLADAVFEATVEHNDTFAQRWTAVLAARYHDHPALLRAQLFTQQAAATPTADKRAMTPCAAIPPLTR
jgi:hypothetical protein